MGNKNLRVVVPRNSQKLIRLITQVLEKHAADGAKSPLSGLDMKAFSAQARIASTAFDKSEKLRKESEKAIEERNVALGIVRGQRITEGTALYFVTSVRDMLLGLYKGREHQLTDWGFEVNTSPRTKKDEEPPDKGKES